jgi:hypothetical protein
MRLFRRMKESPQPDEADEVQTPEDERIRALERLGRLRDHGVLTDEEYEAEKRRLER